MGPVVSPQRFNNSQLLRLPFSTTPVLYVTDNLQSGSLLYTKKKRLESYLSSGVEEGSSSSQVRILCRGTSYIL